MKSSAGWRGNRWPNQASILQQSLGLRPTSPVCTIECAPEASLGQPTFSSTPTRPTPPRMSGSRQPSSWFGSWFGIDQVGESVRQGVVEHGALLSAAIQEAGTDHAAAHKQAGADLAAALKAHGTSLGAWLAGGMVVAALIARRGR